MKRHWYNPLYPREGWGVLLLSLALVVIVGTAVADAGWVTELGVMTTVTLVAFVISYLITRSRLPVFLAHVFSLTIGLAWSFRVTANLMPEVYTWPQRWAWLWYRMYVFGGQLLAGGVSDDNLIFVMQMALLVWIVTYLVVWSIFRAHRVWDAIIVSGLLLLLALYYAPHNLTGYLVFFLLAALLLIIRFNLHLQELAWRRAQVHFNAGEITFDFWRAGLALSLVVLALAWLSPSIPLTARSQALDTLRAPWYDMEDRWSRLFTSVRQRTAPGADFSGQSLALGGPRALSDAPVLEIVPSHRLYYWREVALDRYTGHNWLNSDASAAQFGADNTPIEQVSYRAQVPINHAVTVLVPGTAVLATAGQPVWTDRPSRARLNYVEEPLAEGISHLRSRIPFQANDVYTVSGLQSGATVEQLRRSGDAYPEWVTARYLQLPEGLPDRVRQLASTIAATHTNAYDQATAVEAYLRRTIAYNESIDAPPPDRDAVDYVLFDLQQGYCDYYASSMVVLLRTLGIPTRMAAGYAQGQFDYAKQAFVVRQRDAHAWPEVFFAGYGWVEFEPTAARPPVERPSVPAATERMPAPEPPAAKPPPAATPQPELQNRLAADEGEDPGNVAGLLSLPSWFGLLLLVLAAIGALWLKLRRAEAGLGKTETVYYRMQRLASWAGVVAPAWQTPYEYAARVAAVVPAGRNAAWRLAELITSLRYAGQTADPAAGDELAATWRALRPVLVRAALRYRLARTFGRAPGD